MELIANPQGNYKFLTGIAPYSAGVVVMSGYEIVHVTLRQLLPYRDGFDLIDQHLSQQNRPRYALCGMELRIPQPLSFDGFAEFNQGYQQILADWDLLLNGRNPVARTNIAPERHAPDEPSLYAFSYTMPCSETTTDPTFVVAGAGDLRDQADLSPEAIVRPGETSTDALCEKAICVMDVMEDRLYGLGMEWSDVTTIDIYTAHPLYALLEATILNRVGIAMLHGVRWHYSRPPIAGLEFEMDLRGIRSEIQK